MPIDPRIANSIAPVGIGDIYTAARDRQSAQQLRDQQMRTSRASERLSQTQNKALSDEEEERKAKEARLRLFHKAETINNLLQDAKPDQANRVLLTEMKSMMDSGVDAQAVSQLARVSNLIREAPMEAARMFNDTFMPQLHSEFADEVSQNISNEAPTPEGAEAVTLVHPDGRSMLVNQTTSGRYVDPNTGERVIIPDGYTTRSSGTTVNNSFDAGKEADAFGTEIGKSGGRRFDEINKAASLAATSRQSLTELEMALDRGAETGNLRGAIVSAQGAMNTLFGTDFEIGDEEVVTSIGNQLAAQMRNPDSGMGLPGSASNQDLKFLKESMPGLGRSPEGNRKLLGIAMKSVQFKENLAEYSDSLMENTEMSGREYIAAINKFTREYEWITDEEREELEAIKTLGDPSNTSQKSVDDMSSIEEVDQAILELQRRAQSRNR